MDLGPSCRYRSEPGDPESPIAPGAAQPDGRLRDAVDGYRRRAQAELDDVRRRLTRAQSDRAIAGSRRLRLLRLAGLRRNEANVLRRRAATAQKRVKTAEKQMVEARESALEEVRARRAAYSTELLNWLGSRASAFALAVWLLLMALLAAGWRPMLAWLAIRRAGGLDGAAYAKGVAVTAATVAGGAVAASAFSPALDPVLAPLAVPVIAAMVMLLGLTAWRSTAVRVGAEGVPVALADRRLVPGMAVVLTLVPGLGIGLIGLAEGEPAEPRVAAKTAALARLAEPDPTARPTKRVARLRREADGADSRARRADVRALRAEGVLRHSEEDISAADETLSAARRAVDQRQRQVDRLQRRR